MSSGRSAGRSARSRSVRAWALGPRAVSRDAVNAGLITARRSRWAAPSRPTTPFSLKSRRLGSGPQNRKVSSSLPILRNSAGSLTWNAVAGPVLVGTTGPARSRRAARLAGSSQNRRAREWASPPTPGGTNGCPGQAVLSTLISLAVLSTFVGLRGSGRQYVWATINCGGGHGCAGPGGGQAGSPPRADRRARRDQGHHQGRHREAVRPIRPTTGSRCSTPITTPITTPSVSQGCCAAARTPHTSPRPRPVMKAPGSTTPTAPASGSAGSRPSGAGRAARVRCASAVR